MAAAHRRLSAHHGSAPPISKAAQVLENAISREPSRTDLRLKLLSVYADNQDRDAFEKQYREVEALDDEAAIQEAESLRERLAEAEAMPSIDDLESQLRSDSFGSQPEQEPARIHTAEARGAQEPAKTPCEIDPRSLAATSDLEKKRH